MLHKIVSMHIYVAHVGRPVRKDIAWADRRQKMVGFLRKVTVIHRDKICGNGCSDIYCPTTLTGGMNIISIA
jgi:hypothetical protein